MSFLLVMFETPTQGSVPIPTGSLEYVIFMMVMVPAAATTIKKVVDSKEPFGIKRE